MWPVFVCDARMFPGTGKSMMGSMLADEETCFADLKQSLTTTREEGV